MAPHPTAGPSASTTKLYCHPQCSAMIGSPPERNHGPGKPDALLQGKHGADISWVSELRGGRGKLTGVRDRRHSPDHNEGKQQPGRRDESERACQTTHTGDDKGADRNRRPSIDIGKPTGCDGCERTSNTNRDECGHQRLDLAGMAIRRHGGCQETHEPSPESVQLPHVPVVTDAGQKDGTIAKCLDDLRIVEPRRTAGVGAFLHQEPYDERAGAGEQAQVYEHRSLRQSAASPDRRQQIGDAGSKRCRRYNRSDHTAAVLLGCVTGRNLDGGSIYPGKAHAGDKPKDQRGVDTNGRKNQQRVCDPANHGIGGEHARRGPSVRQIYDGEGDGADEETELHRAGDPGRTARRIATIARPTPATRPSLKTAMERRRARRRPIIQSWRYPTKPRHRSR
jgi:hypothetical protein